LVEYKEGKIIGYKRIKKNMGEERIKKFINLDIG
jgi:hypothetical protein